MIRSILTHRRPASAAPPHDVHVRDAPAAPSDPDADPPGRERLLERVRATLGDRPALVALLDGSSRRDGFRAWRLEPGLPAVASLHAGEPSEVLARCADELPGALVVLATDPADGFDHLVRVGIALELMERCGAPVLLMPVGGT